MTKAHMDVAALLCTVLLAAGNAMAEPRGAVTTGAEPGPDTPMDVFLGRMVGKFAFEGAVSVSGRADCPQYCETVKGTGDCVAIGTGPGVQCILNATWQEMWETVLQQSEGESVDGSATGVFELPGGVPYLDPAMALFGLDPRNGALSYLLVNNKGMPEGGPGFVKGNRATFRTKCVNEPALLAAMRPVNFNERKPDTCDRNIYVDAKPDSKVVWWTIEIDINEDVFTRFTLTLRRQPREEADVKAAKP